MKLSTIPTPLPIEYGWLKFYKKPWALSMENWDIFDAEIKKKHPIQYFLREELPLKLWVCRTKLNDYIWAIRHRISNPRKEMRKVVFPARYEDLPEIIVNFNKEVIIEIYEREKYFDKIEPSSIKSKSGRFEKNLKKYYKYVTETRPQMLDEADKILKEHYGPPMKKKTKIWASKYETIDKLDNEMCLWVSANREYFWT
jgi:hypothetical protein